MQRARYMTRETLTEMLEPPYHEAACCGSLSTAIQICQSPTVNSQSYTTSGDTIKRRYSGRSFNS